MIDQKGERGITLILAAIALFSIFAVLTLCFDALFMYNVREQYDGAATQAALAAMEAIQNSTKTTYKEKLEDGRDRATAVLTAAIGTHGISSSRVTSGAHTLTYPWETPSGENGNIWHGIWHFTEPATASPCGTGANFKPCFEKLTDSTLYGNAIQIEAHLAGGSLVRSMFARVGLMNTLTMGVGTVKGASLVPRLELFIPDVSMSSVTFSHLQSTPIGIDAYPLAATGSCAVAVDSSQVMSGGTQALFAQMQSTRPTRPGSENNASFADKFYMSDYGCAPVASGNADCDSYKFYIDKFSFRTPQPLGAILTGVNTSLTRMRQRGTLSDLVGLIGFDSGPLLACRASQHTLGTIGLLSVKNDADYDSLMAATNLANAADSSARANRMLYPRYKQTNGYPVKTDMVLALRKAHSIVTSEIPESASRSMRIDFAVFSDGDTNCYETSKIGSCPAADVSGNDPISGSIARCCKTLTADADGNPLEIKYSVDEILAEFDCSADTLPSGDPLHPACTPDELLKRKVALHMVLFGNSVHELVYSKGDGKGCLNSDEANAAALPITNSTGGVTTVPVKRTWYTNRLWEAVDKSGGLWWPVRPPCSSSTDPAGAGTDYHAALASACNAVSDGLGGNPGNQVVNLYGSVAVGSLHCSGSCTAAGCTYVAGDPEICRYIDGNGRLMCDLGNRDQTAQVAAFIDELTKINPFVPVSM